MSNFRYWTVKLEAIIRNIPRSCIASIRSLKKVIANTATSIGVNEAINAVYVTLAIFNALLTKIQIRAREMPFNITYGVLSS